MALVTIGILLIVFGGLVLLLFPNRPGGQIEFANVRIDSKGAGLPLIVLGLAAVVLAVLRGGPQPEPAASTPTGSPATTTTGELVTTTSPPPDRSPTSPATPASSCIDEHLDNTLANRLPEGQTTQVVGKPAALILMRGSEITGAVRLDYQPIGDPTLTVIDVVDGSCRPGTATVAEVHNGFMVTLVLPDRQYRLDVDYGSSRAIPKATLNGPQ